MKIHPTLVFVLCAGAFLRHEGAPPPLQSNQFDCSKSIICPDEDLVYEVSWMKIPLGQIHLRTSAPKLVDGQSEYVATAHVDSYSGLPFVDLHAVDQSRMDTSFYSRGFDAMEKKGDEWQSEKSRYDIAHKRLIIEKAIHPTRDAPGRLPYRYDTLNLASLPVQDGLSILYFARAMTRSRREVRVPTVVYSKQGATRFHFLEKTDYQEIDALKDKKIRVVPLEGKAEFEGIFGFSGDFKGWFSDDVAAIPIKAELGVLLGSITIELSRWSRNGWQPPQ